MLNRISSFSDFFTFFISSIMYYNFTLTKTLFSYGMKEKINKEYIANYTESLRLDILWLFIALTVLA